MCTSQLFSTLSLHSTILYILGNKRKRKKQIIFLYISIVVVLPSMQHNHNKIMVHRMRFVPPPKKPPKLTPPFFAFLFSKYFFLKNIVIHVEIKNLVLML